ncbi:MULTISPECIES: hypothetical protein [Pseudomonas]|uniref:Uncharacterized protein n=1 Tax=Pseudomonas fluorescens TaxID=294 RepID=A0A5E6U8J4_PSEFL|nr:MULTISPECIES: hypothetical protein [Pseudomonas]VVM97425.1 hypothetical protein PS652_03111 [Pseudomonas fluorescens]
MKYLLIVIASYGATFFVVGSVIEARLQDLAEDLRYREQAPTKAQYLRKVRPSVQRSKFEAGAWLGTLLALGASLLVWLLS